MDSIHTTTTKPIDSSQLVLPFANKTGPANNEREAYDAPGFRRGVLHHAAASGVRRLYFCTPAQLRVYPRQAALDLLAGSWGPHVEGRAVPGMV